MLPGMHPAGSDTLTLHPLAVTDTAAAYRRTAALLDEWSARLAGCLSPLVHAVEPVVAQEIQAVDASFRAAFSLLSEGHAHAGAALDDVVVAVEDLDREQAARW
jgi:hypothetical protein